ncbi:MAG TPA: SHOCT domain-containing protein [Anaerolineales bacterium]|nr:SHOCT domain-containing protein [Anaerolineales bacterium]
MPTPTCPHCGAQSAVPILGLADKIGTVFKTLLARRAGVASFANADYLSQFEAGQIEAVCTRCGRRFRGMSREPVTARPAQAAIADRLRELDALRAQGLITDDEYRAQRERILSEL